MCCRQLTTVGVRIELAEVRGRLARRAGMDDKGRRTDAAMRRADPCRACPPAVRRELIYRRPKSWRTTRHRRGARSHSPTRFSTTAITSLESRRRRPSEESSRIVKVNTTRSTQRRRSDSPAPSVTQMSETPGRLECRYGELRRNSAIARPADAAMRASRAGTSDEDARPCPVPTALRNSAKRCTVDVKLVPSEPPLASTP